MLQHHPRMPLNATTATDEQHSNLLNPTFALSATLQTSPPSYDSMSSAELEALLTEMEADVRAADRDLREIEMLENKDVTAAGRLPEYEALQPRLDALQKAHEEDLQKAADLEQRISGLVHRYATNVRASFRHATLDADVNNRSRPFRTCLSHGTTRFATRRLRWRGWRKTTLPDSVLVCPSRDAHVLQARFRLPLGLQRRYTRFQSETLVQTTSMNAADSNVSLKTA